jgi:BioD-like phosphotransacetylase family protein
MAKMIFVAATGQNVGKTTICLSLLHLARHRYGRVGFIKPLGPKPVLVNGLLVDKDPALMAQVFGWEDRLDLMSPMVIQPGMTRQALAGTLSRQDLEGRILEAVARLQKECDFLVVEGAGHSGVGSVFGLSNARLAALIGAPVLMVSGGGIGNVIDSMATNLALFRQEGAQFRLLVANKIIPEKREETLGFLQIAFQDAGFAVMGGFNYQPVLANPTLKRVANLLDLEILGDQEEAMRIIHHVQIGAASTQRVVDLLRESTLLLVTSSRDELLVTLANLYTMEEYRPRIVGLVIPGIAPISRITQQILDRSGIPYLRTNRTTADLFLTITEDVSKITSDDHEKIALIQKLAEKRFDFDSVDRLFS